MGKSTLQQITCSYWFKKIQQKETGISTFKIKIVLLITNENGQHLSNSFGPLLD